MAANECRGTKVSNKLPSPGKIVATGGALHSLTMSQHGVLPWVMKNASIQDRVCFQSMAGPSLTVRERVKDMHEVDIVMNVQ